MPSEQERDRRYTALRNMMKERGYGALIMAGNAEAMQRGYIRYVSDWRLWGGKGFAVFPLDSDPILILGAGSQAYWSQRVGWIGDVHAAGDMVAETIHIVQSLGLSEAVLGTVGLHDIMCFGDAHAVQEQLPSALLVDATSAVDDVMAVKSAEELAMAAETYRFVAQAHAVFRRHLAPGKSECYVMAQAVGYLAECGCLDGIAHLTSAPEPFFRPPTDRLIQVDDIIKVSLEFSGPTGYWIELSSIYSFREPPPRQQRYFDTSVRAIAEVAAMLQPGVTGGDVTRTIEDTFRRDGWQLTGRGIWDGHLIGLNVIRPPFGLIDSADQFRENMIFNVHPGLLVDDDRFGILVQDNLVVTPDGGRPLDHFEHRWQIVPDSQ